jgi:hypothetical protein
MSQKKPSYDVEGEEIVKERIFEESIEEEKDYIKVSVNPFTARIKIEFCKRWASFWK